MRLAREMADLKQENSEIKDECDRLELAYNEILQDFNKVTNIQQEIIDMTQKSNDLGDLLDKLLQVNIEELSDENINKFEY